VTADASGYITDQFNLPNRFVANYSVKATGASGAVATTTFTDKDKPTVSLTSSANPSTVGQSVAFSASVTGPSGAPTGDIDFTDGGAAISGCSNVGLNPAGKATCTTSTLTAGSHTIKASYKGDGTYSPDSDSLPQTVNAPTSKPKLTFTCDNKSREDGDANPTLTATITGFQGTDTQANSTTGTPTCSTAANATSAVSGSPYTITASQGTLASTKYDFTLVNGNLTVNKAPLTVTSDNKSKTYGDADPALTYSITNGSLATGDSLSGSLTRDAGQDVGSYAIKQGTLAANSNYSIGTFIPGTLKIVYGTTYGGIQQPINAEGSSRFKTGSTIPVKFTLSSTGSPLNNAVAYLNVKKLDNNPDTGLDEAILTVAPSSGNQFRLGDATTGQYIYNLSTKNAFTSADGNTISTWSQGTYQLQIVLDDGTARTVIIQLVK